MENLYNCNLCKYSTNNKYYFNTHCKTKEHLLKEEIYKQCILCNKTFKSKQIYIQHKRTQHENNKLKKITNISEIVDISNNNLFDKSNLITINNNLQKINKNIIESNKEIIEVKTTVNRAINKASSLIKYLMEKHPTVPPLKKITTKKCIDILRIDFDCPYTQTNKYELEKEIIYEHSKGRLINVLYKSILNLVNYNNPDKQPIYNTDYTRNNYIIKTNKLWDDDLAGVRFTDYIIKPVLNIIGEMIKDYRINELETVNMRKNSLHENEKHLEQLGNTLTLECDIYNDKLINSLLKKLSPYLRYFEKEIEELEKFDEIKKIQNELEEIINFDKNNLDNDDYISIKKKSKKKNNIISDNTSYDSDSDYIKRINKRII